ncbi:unnamed protein product [Lathyrus sativus]|nr:unnamed protein product [Lathyrus sativus]
MSSHGVPAAEALLASGRNSEKLNLPTLQSKMKCDPEGYESEPHPQPIQLLTRTLPATSRNELHFHIRNQ